MLYVNLCWLVLIWSIITIPIYLLVFNQSSQHLWLKWISFTLLSSLFATIYLIYTSAVYSPLYWHVVVAIDVFILVVYALGLIYAINQLFNFINNDIWSLGDQLTDQEINQLHQKINDDLKKD